MSSDIKVSVCVVTYNQEKYIAECLQSLVDQVTDFPFEIIVGEDCSTDNTREIVENFAKKYPDLIVRNFHVENVGAVQNAITTYKMAKGEYICHMDGDDGALPGKLKKVTEIFEKHQDVVMVTHDCTVKDIDSKIVKDSLKRFTSGKHDINSLVRNLPFFTNSAKTVKKDVCLSVLDFLDLNAIDVELHLLESQKGNIYHYDECFGFYRALTGVSSSQGRVNPLIVQGYVRAFENLLNDYYTDVALTKKELRKLYSRAILNFSYQSLYFNRNKEGRDYATKSFQIGFFSFKQVALLVLSFLGNGAGAVVRARSERR